MGQFLFLYGPAFPRVTSFFTLVAQQIPCDRGGATIQHGWATREPKAQAGAFEALSVGWGQLAPEEQCKASTKHMGKIFPSKSETLHPGTVPSQIFGLCFAIPPSKSRYVLSKRFIKIKHDPRASPVFMTGSPQERDSLGGICSRM